MYCSLLEPGAFVCLSPFSPEETLPGGEVGAFEQGVLQDALHATQSLDHVGTVVVQIPQLAVVPLMGPPEGVLLQHLHAHKPVLSSVKGTNNRSIVYFNLRNSISKWQTSCVWCASYLILFEVGPDPPALVVGQRVSVLLEQSVDAGDAPVPGVLQVLQGQTPETQEMKNY